MNNVAEHAREQKAGMKCPQCGAFIETSIFELLTSNALQCPSCHLRLNIDRMKSKAAFDALRKVQNAQENLERKASSTVKRTRHEIDFSSGWGRRSAIRSERKFRKQFPL